MQLFDQQPQAYRDEVLPPSVTARVAVEKASPFGWDRWVGHTGAVIGMSTFGESAPMKVLQAKFGFTTENIVAKARAQLGLDHAEPEGTTLEPRRERPVKPPAVGFEDRTDPLPPFLRRFPALQHARSRQWSGHRCPIL